MRLRVATKGAKQTSGGHGVVNEICNNTKEFIYAYYY